MTELVPCKIRDRVAVLTLNRPEKLNAPTFAPIDRMPDGACLGRRAA